MWRVLAGVAALVLLIAGWRFSPRRTAVRRDPEATPLALVTEPPCVGPRLDLGAPGDDREPICGFFEARADKYAWTRHALFMMDYASKWALLARSAEPLDRVVAFGYGRFVFVNRRNELLEPRGDGTDFLPARNETLARFDLDRVDAREAGQPAPASPLRCLATAEDASLSLYKSHGCFDPGAFSVRVAVGPLGAEVDPDTGVGLARPIAADDARKEFVRVEEALLVADVEGAIGSVRLTWSCDSVEHSMSVPGTRAQAIYAIASSWR